MRVLALLIGLAALLVFSILGVMFFGWSVLGPKEKRLGSARA